MNIIGNIQSIRIDLPLVQAILGSYLNDGDQSKAGVLHEMKLNIASDTVYCESAYQAVNDAVVMSSLASALLDEKDFTESLSTVSPIQDPFLRDMRLRLFLDSLDTTHISSEADEIIFSSRVEAVRLAFN